MLFYFDFFLQLSFPSPETSEDALNNNALLLDLFILPHIS